TVPKTSSEDNPKTISGFKKDLAEGIKLVKNSKAIMTVISIAIVLNFTISPFMSVGLTFLVKEVLQQSDFKFGLLQTVFFLSMVATPLLLTAKMKKMNLGKMIVRGFIIVSMLIVVVALTAFEFLSSINNGLISFIIILLSAFFMGILITAVNISIHTLIQKIVPLEYMGRASTVLGLFSVIAIPIGQMIFGYLYDIINPGFVFIINAFIVLISVFIFRERLINIETEGISILETKTKVESSVTLNEV
ncbi:MAG: MFS transporter, partial [Candidatus Izemoplasmatales bacterium]